MKPKTPKKRCKELIKNNVNLCERNLQHVKSSLGEAAVRVTVSTQLRKQLLILKDIRETLKPLTAATDGRCRTLFHPRLASADKTKHRSRSRFALELRVKRQTESVCSSADGWRCLCSSREGGGDKAGFQTVCDVAELSNLKWQLNLKVC